MLVSSSQLKRVRKSTAVRNGRDVLTSITRNSNISATDIVNARDYLILEIQLSCAHRSGVCANMKMGELENASVNEDGTRTIKVQNHKTYHCYGPAMVVVTNDLFELITKYTTHIRSLSSPGCDNVFVSTAGKTMESGAISRQINSLFLKAGVLTDDDLPKNMSCTLIRKLASTNMRKNQTGNLKEAASLMAHSVSTQEKHYVLQEKAASALIGAQTIRSIFSKSQVNIIIFQLLKTTVVAMTLLYDISLQASKRKKFISLNFLK